MNTILNAHYYRAQDQTAHIIDAYPVDAGGRVFEPRPSGRGASVEATASTVQISGKSGHQEPVHTYRHLASAPKTATPETETINRAESILPEASPNGILSNRARRVFDQISDQAKIHHQINLFA